MWNLRSYIRFIKPSWSSFSVLVGLVGLGFFLWTYSEDQFIFEIILENEENLVEIREQIPDLEILYKNEDLLDSNNEIKSLIITFRNSGKTILQTYYDTESPFGISFGKSKVLGSKLIDTNSKYLREKLNHWHVGNKLYISKVIFDRSKYVTLKVYIMQTKGQLDTDILPLGKIAGIDEIYVIREAQEQSKDYIKVPWPDNFWEWSIVSVILVIGSLVISFISIIVGAIFMVIASPKEIRRKRKLRRLYRKIYPQPSSKLNEIFQFYLQDWEKEYAIIIRYLIEKPVSEKLKYQYILNDKEVVYYTAIERTDGSTKIFQMIQDALPELLFKIDQDIVEINPDYREEISKLVNDGIIE